MRKAFGIQVPDPPVNLDISRDFKITSSEAASGGEKIYRLRKCLKIRKLMVKIPAGIQTGTRIHLKGLGKKEGNQTGDLFLIVKVTPAVR